MHIVRALHSKLNKHRPGIKLYWWRQPSRDKRNFGDEVTPVLIEKLWGVPCRWTRLADCEMVGAGSILDIVQVHKPHGRKLYVWGSGFIEDGPKYLSDDLKVSLVRGPLTASRLQRREMQSIPQGDPGLLASRVFQRAQHVTHKVGVVPHLKDLDKVKSELKAEDFLVISPYQTPEKVAKDITSCELIFSSSLHGLIFADSYAIPNFRLGHSRLEGGDYKFQDYYESTKRKSKVYTLQEIIEARRSEDKLHIIKAAYQPIKHLPEMQKVIVDTFPLKSKIRR